MPRHHNRSVDWRACRQLLLAAVMLGSALLGSGPPPAGAQQVEAFDLLSGSEPRGITQGPDGNLWFTERFGNRIGRISTSGTIQEFLIPTPNSEPLYIATGPDGNLWFTESAANQIGRILPTSPNTITEFPVPTVDSLPCSITAAPDGNLWFAECNVSQIGRITPSGDITEFALTYGGRASYITVGPEGDDLWFTDTTLDKIGRLSLADPTAVTLFRARGAPSRIAPGPDGNLWFTEAINDRIGRVTPSGVVADFTIPTANSLPDGVTAGPDGNIWFTERFGARVGRITPSGAITEFAAPGGQAAITVGPDGNLWFTDRIGSHINRLTPPALFSCASSPEVGCHQETDPQKGLLLLKNKPDKGRDRLLWKWLKGDATTVAELGFPDVVTNYALCIYDESGGTPNLIVEVTAPAAGLCNGKPCWKATGGKTKTGYRYKAPKGFLKIVARAGDAGKAKLIVTSAGVNLALPPLPLSQDSMVVAQLVTSNGECWEADYTSPAIKNDSTQFKAKSN